MEKLITNLQQTYCTRNSYYMSIMKPISWKGPGSLHQLFILFTIGSLDLLLIAQGLICFHFLRQLIYSVLFLEEGPWSPFDYCHILDFGSICCAGGDAACVVGFCDGGCAWSSESPKGWRTQIWWTPWEDGASSPMWVKALPPCSPTNHKPPIRKRL